MKWFAPATLALLMLLGSFRRTDCQSVPQAPKKLPVPDQKAQDQATVLIGELFKDDIARAKSNPDARLKLALTFTLEARDTADDPAGKYILLDQAWNLAASAGDSGAALQAIEELALSFDIPAAKLLAWKTHALQAASQSAATPSAYQATADAALALLEDSIAADAFDEALALGLTAENAAKKLKSVALVSAIRKRNDAVKALLVEYAQVKPFLDALAKDPGDARASLEAGRYYALVRGNWGRGLPLLAKGSDPALKAVAALDLSEPQTAGQMVKLGAMWTTQAGKLQGEASVFALVRAYQWYQHALASPDLADKERAAVEAAMLAINKQLPAGQRVGEIAAELRSWVGHNGPVFGVAISADGSKVASCGADGTVRLWDAKTAKELRRFNGHVGPVWTVQLAPDGKHVLSGGFDGSIRLWDPVSGRESKRLAGHDDYVRALAFSGDGRLVLSGGDDRLVKLWNMTTGSDFIILPGHDHFVFGVAISRDGKRGLSASLDRTLRLWDLTTGQTVHVLKGHTDTVLGVALTPDGRRALSASTDKTLRLWDLTTGQTLHVLKGHTGYVLGVAISPDGRRALSAGQDGKVILWDLDRAQELRVLQENAGPVWSVAFSADGRFAVTAGNDGTIRLWGGSGQ